MKGMSIVGHDFIDASGVHRFCYQWVEETAGKKWAVALIDMEDVVDRLRHRMSALRRLAGLYHKRSRPRKFGRFA